VTAAVIGVDVGTTGVKTVAISPEGEVIAKAEVAYPLSTPRPGWSEQDPEDWWRATQGTLEAMAAAGVDEVRGIGLSGQMHGLVCLDDHDRVLRPAILWNDQRTGAECAEIESRIGLDRLIQLTGNRALTGFTAPKILWLRHHEPDVYSRIARILLPKDYVRLRLTGEHAIDVADASGTLLFDVANRRWSDEVTDALEIPRSWLPRTLESPEVSGQTSAGVVVAAGAGDQAAAALGVGVDRPGPLSVVLGTSGVVFAALPAYAAEPQARVHVFCHAVPGSWHAMGVMLSAAGSMQWFRDTLAPGIRFAELDAEAARWEPGSDGLFFLPYLAGERTPHADPDARGAFIGLSLRHDRAAMVRSVMEGVAYGLRDSLELLTGLGVRAVDGRASGGGARSRLWLSIVASALGVPLELTSVEEGSAFGAALLGGVAGGVFGDAHEAVTACVRVREVIDPRRDWEEAYAAGYRRFRELYPALRPRRSGSPGRAGRAGRGRRAGRSRRPSP
jgi:xylulokinase